MDEWRDGMGMDGWMMDGWMDGWNDGWDGMGWNGLE